MKQILLNIGQDKADMLRIEAFDKRTSVQKLLREAVDIYLNKSSVVKLSDEAQSKLLFQSNIQDAVEEAIAFWCWGLHESREGDEQMKLIFEDFHDSFKTNRPSLETKIRKVFRHIISLDYDEKETIQELMRLQCWQAEQEEKEEEEKTKTKLFEYGIDLSFNNEKILVDTENNLLQSKIKRDKINTYYVIKNKEFPYVIYGEKFMVMFK